MPINYRQYVTDLCEKCGCVDKRVLIGHHKDRDRTNNAPENIQTLCFNCHYLVHAELRFKDKDMTPKICEFDDGRMRAIFPKPLTMDMANDILLYIGHRRGNSILTRKSDGEMIGFICAKEDFMKMINGGNNEVSK